MFVSVFSLFVVFCFGLQDITGLDARRCRSTADFARIPWLLNTSTFHNLGYPLIHSLCNANTMVKNSTESELLGCKFVAPVVWDHTVDMSTRSCPLCSTIIVDPHGMDEMGATSGVFVMNAMYAQFYELGYLCGVRHWSLKLQEMFSDAVNSAAVKSSSAWDNFITTGKDNPYQHVEDYITVQPEVGMVISDWNKPPNESPYFRGFRLSMGLHESSAYHFYQNKADQTHCLGMNHYLGEGLFCSSSGVIGCPMMAFHLKKSQRVTPQTRLKLKENLVLIDNDAHIDWFRLESDLRAKGLADVKVLTHEGRKRHEVPALYTKVKVSLDCRNPGTEYINLEGAMYDVLSLACSSRVMRNTFDFPIPSKYRLEPTDWPQLVSTVHELLVNYTQHVDEFAEWKKIAKHAKKRIPNQIDTTFFSRDTLFR